MYTWDVAMKSEYCFVISIVLDNLSMSFLHIYRHHINLPLYPVEKKFGKIAPPYLELVSQTQDQEQSLLQL